MTTKQKVLARLEQGQSLLIIGVVMVGLIALMGLAIDGGNLFMQRRRAQNAADAVALAATQVLAKAFCDENIHDSHIEDAIEQYAEAHQMNSVDTTILADYVNKEMGGRVPVGNGKIPDGTQGISVTIAYDYATYFVVVVGVDTAAASAQATALTGETRVHLGGLRPFGLPAEVALPPKGGTDGFFTMCFGMHCNSDEDCTVEYLDEMGDQTAAHRGWINYNCIWYEEDAKEPLYPRIDGDCDNVGAKDLKEWMRDGWAGPLYIDDPWWEDWYYPAFPHDVGPMVGGTPVPRGSDIGDFVHASAGLDQSVIFAAEDLIGKDGKDGELIVVPVYDVYMPYEFTPEHRPDPGASQGGNNYYHIVGATVVELTGTSTKHHCISGRISELIVSRGELVGDLVGYGEGGCPESGILMVALVD